jgi:uncharacterized cupredoxin-like copper-binding protein
MAGEWQPRTPTREIMINLTERILFPLVAIAAAAAMPASSRAAGTIVHVTLWDKGADVAMPTNLGMGMGGDMSKATMGIKAAPDTVRAGEVTFDVKDVSKDTIHEMIVARLEEPEKPLPYIANENRVNEEVTGDHLGEVSELDPGASGALKLNLKPGKYILYCNVPGHYMAGMWTTFSVK